ESWHRDALALVDAVAAARLDHEGHRLSTRWNARARRDRAALGRAEQALLSGGRIGPRPPDAAPERDARTDGIGHRGLHCLAGLARHARRPPDTGRGRPRR